MAFLNDNYSKLKAGYLFPEIARRVKAFTDANSDAAKRMIRCGIGDVTEPLPGFSSERMSTPSTSAIQSAPTMSHALRVRFSVSVSGVGIGIFASCEAQAMRRAGRGTNGNRLWGFRCGVSI